MSDLDLDALERVCEPDANGSWYDIDAAGVSHKATDGSPYAIVRKPELRALIQRLREAERGRMTTEQIQAEFEEMKAEFGTGEGSPEVTPEGEILWLAQHNAELKIRIAQLELAVTEFLGEDRGGELYHRRKLRTALDGKDRPWYTNDPDDPSGMIPR